MINTPLSLVEDPVVAKLEIVIMASGRLQVNGQLENKMFCYGMLELARDVIQAYRPPANGIIPVQLNQRS